MALRIDATVARHTQPHDKEQSIGYWDSNPCLTANISARAPAGSLRTELGARTLDRMSWKLLASSASSMDSARHDQIAAIVAFTSLSMPSSPPSRRPSKNTSATA